MATREGRAPVPSGREDRGTGPFAATDDDVPGRGRRSSSPPERERDLAAQFDRLALDEIQRAYLRERWLVQVRYLGRAARVAQRRYYALRLVAILGGVTIPALIGINLGGDADAAVRGLAFGLGLLVAAAVALEEFFRWGERWRHYRQQAELLRGEGWAYLELAGPAYRRHETHAEAFRPFVARVEEAIRHEVGVYIAEVARPPDDPRGGDGGAGSGVRPAANREPEAVDGTPTRGQ